MTDTHKILARTVVVTEVSRFTLAQGENLDERVAKEIDAAGEAGKLTSMATRVGLPAISVGEIGEGEGLSGGENTVSIALYAPDGSPLGDRRFKVEPIDGSFIAIAVEDDVEIDTPIGVFPSEAVAEQVGLFWRNGHLKLPS